MQFAKKAKGKFVRQGGNCRLGQRYLDSISVEDVEDADKVAQLMKKIKSTSAVTPTKEQCERTPGKRKVDAGHQQEVNQLPDLYLL